MTVIEHAPAQEDMLDFINDSIRQLQEAGLEAKYLLVGKQAYEALRHAIAARFRREPGYFETYNYLPIVLDPFRTDTVCVLPAPRACAQGVHAVRTA